MIYTLTLLPLVIHSFLSMLKKDRNINLNYLAFVFVIILILIAGLRDGTGTDTKTYASIWRNILPFDEYLIYGYTGRDYLEPGFRIFVSILKMFTVSSITFFIIMASITLGFLYAGLRKIPQINLLLAIAMYLMIFYMPYTLNAMRQAVAMSIFIFVLPNILNAEFKKTFFWTLLAASFHSVGFLIILAYIVAQSKVKLLPFIFSGLVFSALFYYFKVLKHFLDIISPGLYSLFVDNENWGSVDLVQIVLRFLILASLVFSALFVYKQSWFSKLVMVYSIGFFIYIALAESNMLAARFNLFFRILEVVMFPIIVVSANKFSYRFLYFVIALTFGIYTFYINLLNEDNIYVSIF